MRQHTTKKWVHYKNTWRTIKKKGSRNLQTGSRNHKQEPLLFPFHHYVYICRPCTLYDGRLCFHMCLSVHREGREQGYGMSRLGPAWRGVRYILSCFWGGGYVPSWRVCTVMEGMSCHGGYVLSWRVCTVMEGMYCHGEYVLSWFCLEAERGRVPLQI